MGVSAAGYALHIGCEIGVDSGVPQTRIAVHVLAYQHQNEGLRWVTMSMMFRQVATREWAVALMD